MKLNWNFLGGGGGEGCKTKTFCGGNMDIFWDYTIVTCIGFGVGVFKTLIFKVHPSHVHTYYP